MLELMSHLVELWSSIEARDPLLRQLFEAVFDRCLMANPYSEEANNLPKCKAARTRGAAFQLCTKLMHVLAPLPAQLSAVPPELLLDGRDVEDPRDHPNIWHQFFLERVEVLFDVFLGGYHMRSSCSLSEISKQQYLLQTLLAPTPEGMTPPNSKLFRRKWGIAPATQVRWSNSGFSGLKNLGCICYMNSLLQQYFANDKIREGILSVSIESELAATQKMIEERRELELIARLDDEDEEVAEPEPIDPEAESVAYQLMRMLSYMKQRFVLRVFLCCFLLTF
jgi:Ubiquitin carboxyl-terminal hydrolase